MITNTCKIRLYEPPGKSRRVVVLGASGFLGSNLVRYLASSGHDVLATARRDLRSLGFPGTVATMTVDVCDRHALEAAFLDREIVFHFASSTNLLTHCQLDEELDATLTPAKNILAACKSANVRQVVFPSSGCVYENAMNPRTERSAVRKNFPYAQAKLRIEELFLNECARSACRARIFRIGNPYGPKQEPRSGQGVIPYWLSAIKRGEPVVVRGDGSATRDFVFIKDLCQVMESVCDDQLNSEIYNLGTGKGVSLNELLNSLRMLARVPINVKYHPAQSTDLPGIALSPQKLLNEIPWFSFTSLQNGLAQTLEPSESTVPATKAA